MSATVSRIIAHVTEFAPECMSEKWDNTGLQVGSAEGDADAVLLALDPTEQVVEEARETGASFIVTHHPLLVEPVRSIMTSTPSGRVIRSLLANGISLYAAHTSLDKAPHGVSWALARELGLEQGNPLNPESREDLLKLAVFVPATHLDAVRQSLGDAGAGWIGRYSHCSFTVGGTGSFRPLAGADPFVGEIDETEEVEECRVETIVPSSALERVVDAMVKAHPYEEVAYDVYPLRNRSESYGLGYLGELAGEVSLRAYAAHVKDRLGISHVRVTGDLDGPVRTVAVCGGSGSHLVERAASVGADVFVTGDVEHDTALEAESAGIFTIDAGHFATERPVLTVLAQHLEERIGEDVEVVISSRERQPFASV